MATTAVPRKPRRLVEYLQEQIHTGRFAPGDRIPAIRALMEMFDLSYGSVRRGIDYLARAGLLDKRVGEGVYVRRHEPDAGRPVGSTTVAVCMRGEVDSGGVGIYATVFMGIQDAARAAGCGLSIKYVNEAAVTAEGLLASIEEDGGAILLLEYDRFLDDLRVATPVVGVCNHSTFGGKISTIDMDPVLAAEQATAQFRARGVRTVVVVTPTIPAYRHRGDVFVRVFTESGGTCRMQVTPDRLRLARGTGVLFTSGAIAQKYSLQHKGATGRPIAEDRVAIGLDGKNTLDPTFDPMPSIRAPWRQIGRLAFEEVQQRLRQPGRSTRRMYVPGSYVDGAR